jgi:hypothetical protein
MVRAKSTRSQPYVAATHALLASVLIHVNACREQHDEEEEEEGGMYEDGKEFAPALTIQPTIAGVGVLFSGTVMHAGRGVTSGATLIGMARTCNS